VLALGNAAFGSISIGAQGSVTGVAAVAGPLSTPAQLGSPGALGIAPSQLVLAQAFVPAGGLAAGAEGSLDEVALGARAADPFCLGAVALSVGIIGAEAYVHYAKGERRMGEGSR
jgi:hypothetical protein